jgi:hypothetical protein
MSCSSPSSQRPISFPFNNKPFPEFKSQDTLHFGTLPNPGKVDKSRNRRPKAILKSLTERANQLFNTESSNVAVRDQLNQEFRDLKDIKGNPLPVSKVDVQNWRQKFKKRGVKSK